MELQKKSVPAMTGAEKIIARASGKPFVKAGDVVYPVPDMVMRPLTMT